ncbi:hypothetical protein Tco_0603888 [Tanacetum coccineum]
MVRDIIQLETAVSTISQEYLLEFTSEYGITEDLHPELPGPRDMIVDFLKGKVGVYTKFIEFANFRIPISQFLFDILGHYQIHLSQLSVIGATKVSHFEINYMDLFKLIRAPNPTKVKIGTRPRAAHEVPLLTVNAIRVIEMEELAAATKSSRTPFTIEISPLDFANENPSQQISGDDGTEDQVKGIVASEVPPPENANAPPKVLRKDHAASRPTQSTAGGKSLASVGLETGSTFPVPASQEIPADASDPDLLSYANPQSIPKRDVAQYANRSYFPLTHIFQGSCRCGRSRVREYLLHFHGRVTRKHIPTRVGRDQRLSPGYPRSMPGPGGPPSTARAQVTREEKLKVVFKEFKKYEDDRVEKRCAEMDGRLDALSIDFDEELYPHMLTEIAGHRWVIGHGLRLAVIKCAESAKLRQAFPDVVFAGIAKGMSEGLKYGVEHGKASLDLEVIKAYDPEADTKYVTALHALRDLKYPMVNGLESLKDALIDVIMESFHLESDSGEDAPQWIRELRPSSSQLKIPVYPEVRDPKNPWSFKEEILLEDAIAANVSHAKKKKSVGWCLSILLADAATQTETSEDEASPRLFRSKSLPPMYNLDWP